MSSFEITIETRGGVAIIRLRGDLFFREAERFEADVTALLRSGYGKFVVNLSGLGYVGSSGIGVLVWLYSQVTESQGRMICTEVPSKVTELLQIMELSMIEVMDSEREAYAALREEEAGD